MWVWEAIAVGWRRKRRATALFLTAAALMAASAALYGASVWWSARLSAAEGDFAIYRGTTTEVYGTTPTDVTWNTTVTEGPGFSKATNDIDVTLSQAGHYLVLYNLALESGSGSNRSEIQGYLNLAGSNLAYGRSTCYIRRVDGVNECWLGGAAVVETAAANQIIKVGAQRTDSNSATVQRALSGSGFTILRMDDLFPYARVGATVTQNSNSSAFTAYSWDVDDELDTAVFSRSGAQITLKEAGMYLVTANLMFRNGSGSARRANAIRLTLNGYEIEGTRSVAYMRGSNSTQDHAAVYMGIIRATTTNQILQLEHACVSGACGNVTIVPGESGMTLTKLRDQAEFLRLYEAGGGQALDGASDPILWDTQDVVEPSFSHSTTTNTSRITVNNAGDYLFFGSFYSDTGQTSVSNIRLQPHWQWRTNGTNVLTYGSFAKYKRGNSNPEVMETGNAGGILLQNLSAGDYVEVINTDEATDNDALATFTGMRYALQAVRLDSLFPKDVTVFARGTQVATTSLPATGVELGAQFVFTANRSDETITGITLTEKGTVNAQNGLDNIKLFYDLDTTAPYDCTSESYGGTEPQFGATDTDGFSASDGTSAFTDSVTIGTSSTLCVYVVLDVLSNAANGETIEIEIADPSTDVTIASGEVEPATAVPLPGTTVIQDDILTQIRYHWRLDDGSETAASSATGGAEDTPLDFLSKGVPRRLRLEVSNEGLAGAPPAQFRLEYAPINGTCAAATSWTDVGAAGGAWDMSDSPNLTDGADTTNVAVSAGGVTDENTTFLTPNGGVLDLTSQTGVLALTATDFVELEYSVVALSGASDGTTYCFRVSDAGTALPAYSVYPQVTIAADVRVTATSTQVASVDKNTTNVYLGGVFSIVERTGARNVTSVTIAENGTIDAAAGIDNIKLFYDLDTTAPYDCASESYAGTEPQYGATASAGFSGADGAATFTATVGISTTTALCIYPVMDITNAASNNQTIELEITTPSADVSVSGGGSIAPDTAEAIPGTTVVNGEVLDQFGFHWRKDDGDESTSTSATAGVENALISNVTMGTTLRLRLGVDNTGAATSSPKQFRLEYGERTTTCAAVGAWTDVGAAGGAWDMSDSPNLTDGADTTNVAVSAGGVTDPLGASFLTPNSGVKDLTSQTGALTLSSTDFVELEYSIEATNNATYGATYCFRVTDSGTPLENYSQYAAAQMRPNQDFYVQRGSFAIPAGSTTYTLVPGTDYTAPQDATRAFVRITNTQNTGAGNSTGGGNQNADDVTVFIATPSDFANGIVFERFGAAGDTHVSWEIVEYIGPPGGDNEIVVRYADVVRFTTTGTSSSTPAVTGVADDNDVVVFVTGVGNPDAGRTNFNTGLVTAAWDATSSVATLTRGEAGGDAIAVSVAVVEFTGSNWRVQRVEHTYASNLGAEYETIALSDTSKAFLHVQKRAGTGENGLDEFGHEVWINATSSVAFRLESTASTPTLHTSVAWVIENVQAGGTVMRVTRSSGTQSGGAEPSTIQVSIGNILSSLSVASIFTNNRVTGSGTAYPRPIMGVKLISTTQYELFISDTGQTRTYRTEVVEWPTASRHLTQNYYRFYVDNDALKPTDPWPAGAADLGENTAITGGDAPPGAGSLVRLRMSITVGGGVLSSGMQAFKLQYGLRGTSTCGAITNWLDVAPLSSTTAPWRGYDATPADGTALSGDPPAGGDLLLSVSDRAGSYEEENNSIANPYKVGINEDMEFDWVLQANSVTESTAYCFRMALSDGAALDNYNFYPTLVTGGFGLESGVWQWFDDATSSTPTVPLAGTNTAPVDVTYNNEIKLRWTITETAGSAGILKTKLQYSETSDFSGPVYDVVDFYQCVDGVSAWCYADGGGAEHATITTALLPDADACSGGSGSGCGTRNEYSYVPSVIGEVGTVVTDATGTTVTLQHTYADPVFIVESVSGDATGSAANDPAAAMIVATTSNSFTVRIQEPDNELDDHGSETVHYLVVERGSYVLPGGVKMEAGRLSTARYYGNAVSGTSDDACVFSSPFSAPPVVLTSLQTNNNTGTPDFLTASQLTVTASQFSCSIEVPDGETNAPSQGETIGWVAIEGGAFNNNGIDFYAATSSQSVTGWTDTAWYTQSFPADYFTAAPGIIATRQTRDGAEGGWVRFDNSAALSSQFAIDERDDGERTHTAERVGFLAFSQPGTLVAEGSTTYAIGANASAEHEFTIRHAGAKTNTTYFFRLYDTVRGAPIAIGASSTPASLVTEGGALTLTVQGVGAGVALEGVVTDATTSATTIPFGILPLNTQVEAAQQITVDTNAPGGYRVFVHARQDLASSLGDIMENIAASNTAPLAWASGCGFPTSTSCWGYHTSDNTLMDGSTRFLIDDTYAALSPAPEEIGYSASPGLGETTSVVYKLEITNLQPAGLYQTNVVYTVVPIY